VNSDFIKSNIPSLIGVKINSQQSLTLNKDYVWYFNVICDPKHRDKDKRVNGKIQRTKATDSLVPGANATTRERAELYAQDGLWSEALTELIYEFYRQDPQRAKPLINDLLTSVGLPSL